MPRGRYDTLKRSFFVDWIHCFYGVQDYMDDDCSVKAVIVNEGYDLYPKYVDGEGKKKDPYSMSYGEYLTHDCDISLKNLLDKYHDESKYVLPYKVDDYIEWRPDPRASYRDSYYGYHYRYLTDACKKFQSDLSKRELDIHYRKILESRYKKILEAGLVYPQQVITQLSSVRDILSDVLNSNYDFVLKYFNALNDKLYGWNIFLECYYNIGNERVKSIRTGGINDDSLKVVKEFNDDNFDNFLCLDNNGILTVRSIDVNDVRKIISVEIETIDSYLKVIKFFDRNVSIYFGSLLKNYFIKNSNKMKKDNNFIKLLDSLYKINTHKPGRYGSIGPNIYDYDGLINLCNKLIESSDKDVKDKLASDSIDRYYQSELPKALMDLQNKQGRDEISFFSNKDEEKEEINTIMESFLKIVNDVAVNYLDN